MSNKPVTVEWAAKATAKLLAQELRAQRIGIVNGPIKVWSTDGKVFGLDMRMPEDVLTLPREMVRALLPFAAKSIAEAIAKSPTIADNVVFAPLTMPNMPKTMEAAVSNRSRACVRIVSGRKADFATGAGYCEGTQRIWRFDVLAYAVRPQ